jgi:hypothetical protein
MAGTSRKGHPAAALKSSGTIPVSCNSFRLAKENPDMVNVGQVHYYVMCVSEFAKAKNMNAKDAFNYLHAYKGIEFLSECYEIEHTLSLENVVEDLTLICGNNGGNIL